ncbi:MAG: hypothetical protein IPK85_20455 [Gemmatimonadetes bacterium]|nr:hypothetical protein [Gemmatimonadota bacterium]
MRPLILVPLLASALAAQPNDELALRLRRLDSLAVVRLRELRALDQEDVTARRLHALTVDGIQALVDSGVVALAGEGLRLGLSDVRARGQGWLERMGAQLEIRIVPDRNSEAGLLALSVIASHRENPALKAAVAVGRRNATGIRHAINRVFDQILRNGFDHELTRWLAAGQWRRNFRSSVILVDGDTSLFGAAAPGAPAWEIARTQMVRSPSASSRDCLNGSVPACARSLGLGGEHTAPVTSWYAPSDFRWISHVVARDGDRARQRLVGECDRGVVTSCERMVATTPPGRAAAPLATADVRRGLLLLALDIGGPQAIDRLLSSSRPLPERLGVVAGVPVDSLISTWRARVVATPQGSPPVSGFAIAASLMAAAALLALPRSRS